MLTNVYKILKPAHRILNISVLYIRVYFLRMKNKKIIFLLGVPEHNNVGDLAITWAETSFVKKHVAEWTCVTVPFRVLSGGLGFLYKIVRTDDIIAGHGGGNMGDTYLYEEEMRRRIIAKFPDNKIIIFPQTIYFSEGSTGRAELEKTQKVYSSHNSLTLIAREKSSFEKMKNYFPDNTVILTPDIVLSMVKLNPQHNRKGALTCFRADVESRMNNQQRKSIALILSTKYGKVRATDTTEPGWTYRFKPNRYIVWNKLDQFRHAEVVVTDRLHGMVFCAITGTPCIVFSNFNHKVQGTYDWIKYLNYIKYCGSIDDMEKIDMQSLLSSASDYNSAQFDEYWQKIKNLITEN